MTVAGGTRRSFLYYGDTLVGFMLGNDTYYYLRNLQGDIVQIVDANGAVVVSYRCDDWGKPVSITGSAAATVGVQNPFRYRGYFYDNESGLYYLNSRYYDPETGRFVSADAYVSTGQGVTGFNMFAYCNDNPVNGVDCYGESANSVLHVNLYEPLQYAAGGCIATLAFATSLSLFARFARWIRSVAVGISKSGKSVAIGEEKAEEKAADIAIEEYQQSPTIIYRYYASKTENLSPRSGIDYDGLSFQTKPPRAGVSAVWTTIEAVNSSGVLLAKRTSLTHIVIVPAFGSVEQWMEQGMSSIWSVALSSIVIEWDASQ